MLIGSNLNPYKKLLEAGKKKDYEYYKNLMQSLYDFLDTECEYYDDYVRTSEFLNERYADSLCLEWLHYDINDIDYSYFIEKYDNLIKGEDVITDEVVDKFIKENFRFSYEDIDNELDNKLEIISEDEDDNEEDYFVLGYLTPGYEEWQTDYNDTTDIKIRGKRNKKNIISLIREIPDDIFEQLIDEVRIGNLPIYNIKEDLIDFKNSDGEEYLDLTYSDLGDNYESYPVGIKKETFEEHFIQYLKDEKLFGFQSEDNSVWEEEEEE